MSDIVELAKTFVSPVEKLIDSIQSAIGKVYEPRYNRKMADAKAYEINKVSEAMRNSIDIPVTYDQGNLLMDTDDINDFIKRTKTRNLFQEMTKQQNIDSVIDNAYDVLNSHEDVSNKPIDRDWLNRFFNSVGEVSNEQMQKIWGKILAGEIVSPGNFSLRTLNIVKNISAREASLFLKIAPLIIGTLKEKHIVADNNILHNHDIYFDSILLLSECGLINQYSLVQYSGIIKKKQEDCLINGQYVIILHNDTDNDINVEFSIYALTQAGVELLNVLEYESNINYTSEISEAILQKNKKLRITIHKISSLVSDRQISYDDDIIQTFII